MSEPENDKQIEFRLRQAERAHDRRHGIADRIDGQVLSFSNAAMRAPGIAAAGGIAVALAFITGNYARLSENPEAMAAFWRLLVYFGLSLGLTVLAPGLAYLGQVCFEGAINKERLIWQYPYVEHTRATRNWNRAGEAIRVLTIMTVVAALILLGVGAYWFLQFVTA